MLPLEYEFEIKNESKIIQIKNLKINEFLLIDCKPCKVLSIKRSKLTKLNEYEILIRGQDIFSDEVYTTLLSSRAEVEVPFIKNDVFLLISIDNNKLCTLMDITGNTRTDLKLPYSKEKEQKMSDKIIKYFKEKKEVLVTTCCSMNMEKIVAYKVL